jgi:choline dehydrogenase
VNALAQAFVSSAETLGFKHGDYNCFCSYPNKGIVGLHQQTVRQGSRCDTGRAYVDPLLSSNHCRPNLFVVTSAKCQKVLTHSVNGKLTAYGVELVPDTPNGRTAVTVRCHKEVILSAGSLGSPQILLQSGIGPEGDVLTLSQVGQNLQDHLTTFVKFSGRREKQDIGSVNKEKATELWTFLPNLYQMFVHNRGILTSSTYDASIFFPSNASLPYPDLQLSILCASVNLGTLGIDLEDFELDDCGIGAKSEGLVVCCTLLHPNSEGHGMLNDNDNHNLTIHDNYLSDNEDLRRMI